MQSGRAAESTVKKGLKQGEIEARQGKVRREGELRCGGGTPAGAKAAGSSCIWELDIFLRAHTLGHGEAFVCMLSRNWNWVWIFFSFFFCCSAALSRADNGAFPPSPPPPPLPSVPSSLLSSRTAPSWESVANRRQTNRPIVSAQRLFHACSFCPQRLSPRVDYQRVVSSPPRSGTFVTHAERRINPQ